MVPSLHPLLGVFSPDSCDLQSSIASSLSAGFIFHIRPSFAGPSTLQPYDITCGPLSDLTSLTPFFVAFPLSPPLFVRKREV